MTDFSLIKQIARPQPEVKSNLPKGIEYDELCVETHDAGKMTVFLPKSTSQSFEAAINEYTVVVKSDVKDLLREFRGINGN